MSRTSSGLICLDSSDSVDLINGGTRNTAEQRDPSSVHPIIVSSSYFIKLIRWANQGAQEREFANKARLDKQVVRDLAEAEAAFERKGIYTGNLLMVITPRLIEISEIFNYEV